MSSSLRIQRRISPHRGVCWTFTNVSFPDGWQRLREAKELAQGHIADKLPWLFGTVPGPPAGLSPATLPATNGWIWFPGSAWPTGTRLFLSLHKEGDRLRIVNVSPPYREKQGTGPSIPWQTLWTAALCHPLSLTSHHAYVCAHVCVCTCALSRVRLCVTPWTVACGAPLSMGFSRQEYCSGLPFPPPGDLSDPGIEPTSPVSPSLAGRFFTLHFPQNSPLISPCQPHSHHLLQHFDPHQVVRICSK